MAQIEVPPDFQPTRIAMKAINEKHSQLAGDSGFLGKQATDLQLCPDGTGFFIHYQGGSIYWSPSTGAHEVHGAIKEKWASLGFERSFLRYPLTDETPTPDGVGRFNHFQGGSIYWTLSTAAHEVHGAIREMWASMGWERSFLGYPVSDEIDSQVLVAAVPPTFEVGRESRFQNGSIMWSPRTGAFASPDVLRFQANIATQDWAPIGGSIDIIINPKGHFTFQGHIHNSGAVNIDFALAAVIATPSGIAYGFSHKGHVDGTVTLFGRNRDDDWTDTGVNSAVAENFSQVRTGTLSWKLVAQDTLSKGVQGLLDDLAKEAVKEGLKSLVTLILG